MYIGWTTADAPDETQLKIIGDEMSDLIYQVHSKTYTSDKAVDFDLATGTAADW